MMSMTIHLIPHGNWFTEKKGNVESIMLTQQEKTIIASLRHDSNLLKHYSKLCGNGGDDKPHYQWIRSGMDSK